MKRPSSKNATLSAKNYLQMKTKFCSRFAAFILVVSTMTACNNNDSGNSFTLSGSLDGISEGKAILISVENRETPADTAIIENGKFVFTGNIPEPSQYYIAIAGKRNMKIFYAENCEMTFSGHADSLNKAIIGGGKTEADSKILAKSLSDLAESLKINDLRKELYPAKDAQPLTKEREAEIISVMDKYTEESNKLTLDFIKENPKSYYSAILVNQLCSGKSAVEIDGLISLLDPKLASSPRIMKIKEKVDQMKKTEVGIDSFIKDAHDLTYTVDNNFAGKQHKNVVYLSVLSNNNVCALKSDGSVIVFDANGKKLNEFKTTIKGKASAIAVDKTDNIFVFGSLIGKKSVESRGRTIQVDTPIGIECLVYDTKGIQIKEIKLADLVSATGARVADNKILVADTRSKMIAIFDAQTGEKKSAIENLRTCCGILDFSIRNDNEILVANLGAFRVDGFDLSGQSILSFGQRGNSINDFHGCCNPVSVAFLSNGGVVTVEKDPTRIKVYSKEGAKKIEGIEELVKGCAYIPMTVDSNDNVYLASISEGIVKCISKK